MYNQTIGSSPFYRKCFFLFVDRMRGGMHEKTLLSFAASKLLMRALMQIDTAELEALAIHHGRALAD